ncbi:MAG TPA: glutamine-hydrolyzing carbamoyl-phosphate synthase small subunit [Blastocatellia bacterium]|nr:glutamine-hydrolyzing carbamoyl-phosphate synthase small subunit [Blastocatellia bacterium]
MKQTAILALEDGRIFRGRAWGASGERTGEIVFNTAMTGYQEILTDPSYAGQIVTMTYTEIGNYGVNPEDVESRRPFVEGFVVREVSEISSSWRSVLSLDEYLKRYGIVGISDIDTRALVRHIREKGAMRACISSTDPDEQSLIAKAKAAPSMIGRNLVDEVTCGDTYEWSEQIEQQVSSAFTNLSIDKAAGAFDALGAVRHRLQTENSEEPFHVVAYDFGIKYYILRYLAALGCRITVVPARTKADDVLSLAPDGVFLSNGPGDPAALEPIVDEIRRLLGAAPMFGICLGHQILGHAFGGRTFKLKFGHRGANHPIRNVRTGRIEIASHNHGFAVDPQSLDENEIEFTHWNINDQTLAGFRHRKLPVFSVQYHPEAGPGPHDSTYLFHEFIAEMQRHRASLKQMIQAESQR